ncbi:hypothetical protein ACPCK2_33550 [Streptomyces pseudogriseolus]|uniref:hypothetical protein n=1 Tax=Streptomyces pseudogriseolus TaxID=36817 RepID=UPI003FA1F012
MELAVARLEGAVAERTGRFADLDAAVDITPLEVANAILKATEKAAHTRRTTALKHVLKDVEKDIVTMGRALGLEMLQRVELGTGATLTVWKGGQQHTYGSLTEGEQLRLKIVTTTALLRHGIRSGVGRHPGLLIVDSPEPRKSTARTCGSWCRTWSRSPTWRPGCKSSSPPPAARTWPPSSPKASCASLRRGVRSPRRVTPGRPRGQDKGPAGRALRGLPGQRLCLSLGGGSLFEVLDPERLDQKALEVVKSVEQELADRAVAASEDLAGGR